MPLRAFLSSRPFDPYGVRLLTDQTIKGSEPLKPSFKGSDPLIASDPISLTAETTEKSASPANPLDSTGRHRQAVALQPTPAHLTSAITAPLSPE